MCTGHVDPAQRVHERGEIDGCLIQVIDRSVLAGQPPVHGPFEGVALGRMAHRQLHRNRERQMRREFRQPLPLLGRLVGRPRDARQPSGQVVGEPIDVVICPIRHDRIDRQIGPLRELPGKQTTNKPDIGLDLGGMHLDCGHRYRCLST
jgi:hypothetical protein